jgi:hypothetical protein
MRCKCECWGEGSGIGNSKLVNGNLSFARTRVMGKKLGHGSLRCQQVSRDVARESFITSMPANTKEHGYAELDRGDLEWKIDEGVEEHTKDRQDCAEHQETMAHM